MADIIILLATITGIIMSIAWWPQVIKIFRRKSVEDLSIITYSVFFPSMVIWVVYGFYTQQAPVIITNVIGGTGCGFILLGFVLFKKR
jgi:MtN3 and saliva related transmembrane protein